MEPRVRSGALRGWTNRNGEDVSGFQSEVEAAAEASTSLIWWVNPESRWPVWIQLVFLWLKRLTRRPL